VLCIRHYFSAVLCCPIWTILVPLCLYPLFRFNPLDQYSLYSFPTRYCTLLIRIVTLLETMAYLRSIIQLKPDPSDFIMVKLQQKRMQTEELKSETPTTDFASIDQILYCTREFLETTNQLNFDLGPELFNNCILWSTVKDDWDLVVTLVPQPRIPVVFFTALDEWKRELIMPSAQQMMVDYLETLTKPCIMTIESFVNRVKVMVR
jgi:hypothetical protein